LGEFRTVGVVAIALEVGGDNVRDFPRYRYFSIRITQFSNEIANRIARVLSRVFARQFELPKRFKA